MVREALPASPATVAVMVVVPVASPVAKPDELTVAAAVLDDDHATPDESAFVVPSEYVPVAVNCCVSPAATLVADGLTTTD